MKNRLQYLKDNQDKSNKDLSLDMNVSIEMVAAMRKQNGIPPDNHHRISNKRKKLFKEMYPTADWDDLNEEFSEYTEEQIRNRAYNFGLKREV